MPAKSRCAASFRSAVNSTTRGPLCDLKNATNLRRDHLMLASFDRGMPSGGYMAQPLPVSELSRCIFFSKILGGILAAASLLPASPSLETKVPAKKRQHIILKTISHFTGVSALVYFEAICDSIPVKHIVKFA